MSFAVGALGCETSNAIELKTWNVQVGAKERAVTLPVHLDDFLPAPSRYHIRTTVALPPSYQGEDLLVVVPFLPAATELELPQVPDLAPIREPGYARVVYRAPGPHAWTIPGTYTRRDALELELTIEHRWTQSAWLDTIPRISRAKDGDPRFEAERTATELGANVALGTMMPIGFAYLVLFLLDRRRVANGWFSLQALTGSFYSLYVLGISQQFFGWFDSQLLAVTQAIAPIAGLRFTFATFELGRPPRIFNGFILCSVIAAFVFGRPFQTLPLGILIAVFGACTISYHLYTLARLRLRRPAPRNSGLLLAGWLSIAVAFILDGKLWVGSGMSSAGLGLGSWSLSIIALCQTIALMREHASSLRRADHLNRELLARVAQLEARQA